MAAVNEEKIVGGSQRPRIAVIGRLAEHTSALRYAAVVNARALLQSVWDAGGEPVTLLPVADADWAERLWGCDGVLLPGGGDLDPAGYGEVVASEHVYDVDALQDAADLQCAGHALENGIPLLAVCRGFHVVNVLRGGSLVQDMDVHHRHFEHEVEFTRGWEEFGFDRPRTRVSCYHHQAIARVGDGIEIVATSQDGVAEAGIIDAPGWAVGVQWHPEDTAGVDDQQAALFSELVRRSSG